MGLFIYEYIEPGVRSSDTASGPEDLSVLCLWSNVIEMHDICSVHLPPGMSGEGRSGHVTSFGKPSAEVPQTV